MRFKSIQDFKKYTKDFTKEQLKNLLDNLSDEEQEIIKQSIIMQHKVNFTFYEDDFDDYTEDENELNERIEKLEDVINNFNEHELYYTKESILNPYILRVLAHCIKDPINDLSEKRLNDLIGNYNEINHFINNNNNYDEIIGFYNDIVKKDDNGFFEVNNSIAQKLLNDNNLNVKNTEDLEDIKSIISLTWENKKEILNPNEINNITEKQNGLKFNQFIFCEEYLKRGKIKPTCEHLGISRNTAYLWLDDTKVQDYLNKRKEEIKAETDNAFIQTYRASFNQLNSVIESKYLDVGTRLKAIDVFLKHYENIERIKTTNTIQED